jgi:hypothetical protein
MADTMFDPIDEEELDPRKRAMIAPPMSEKPPINLPGIGPSMPALQPAQKPAGQLGADKQELQRLESTGSGVSQLQRSHPKLGVLARVADVAGSIIAPGAASFIPGTTLHHNALVNRQRGNVEEDATEQQREALGEQEQAKAQALINPPKKLPTNANDAYIQQHPDASPEDIFQWEKDHQISPKPATTINDPKAGYSQAIADAINNGRDPNQDPHVQAWKHALDSIAKTPTETAAMEDQAYQGILQKENMGQPLTPEEQAHKKAYEQRKTLGTRTTFNLNEGNRNDKADNAVRQSTYKAFTPALDSAERFNVMSESAEKAIAGHDQQAMLNLLANHLGMTMGLQKGARLNQALIAEAQHSQPWLAGMQAKWSPDGYLTGVTLSPEQMRQMVALGQSRFHEDTVKARNESRYLGANDDGPDRTPSKATMRYYIKQANGNAQQAKQLASEDGWTVK